MQASVMLKTAEHNVLLIGYYCALGLHKLLSGLSTVLPRSLRSFNICCLTCILLA